MLRRLACLLLLVLVACGVAAQQDELASYARWLRTNNVREFEQYLAAERVAGVLPTRQLLRTASDWERCNGPRFEIPPRERWPQVAQVLSLVAELGRRRIVDGVEGASGYRNPELNACARGAPGSAHTRSFALDITAGTGRIDLEALCDFWRNEGSAWAMGLSLYPSGRIHLDTSGWRTWGADHTRGSAFCAPVR